MRRGTRTAASKEIVSLLVSGARRLNVCRQDDKVAPPHSQNPLLPYHLVVVLARAGKMFPSNTAPLNRNSGLVACFWKLPGTPILAKGA